MRANLQEGRLAELRRISLLHAGEHRGFCLTRIEYEKVGAEEAAPAAEGEF
jgi:hypothetical protein